MSRRHQLLPRHLDIAGYLGSLPPPLRAEAVAQLDGRERDALDRAWRCWAHDGQVAPPGDWSTWVLMAGRGFGKTLAGTQWLIEEIVAGKAMAIALVGASLEDARRVMVEGRSGLLTVAAPWIKDWRPSLRRLRFTTGAEAVIFSGGSPDLLRGPEHDLAWCDELAKWERARDAWDMLQFGLRLGERPRALITTTPRPGPVLREIMAAPRTVVTRGRTSANPHVSAAWRAQVEALYGGTRLGAQELDGELLPEAGALWTPELIARAQTAASAGLPMPVRTLVAVDLPAGDGTCGIVACARDAAGLGHVLGDHSVTARSPEGWARAVADACRLHATQEVVAEGNQGGRMVRSVLEAADADLRVRMVTARHGKSVRAEPVAMLFEAGKVRLHGAMPALAAELCGMIAARRL